MEIGTRQSVTADAAFAKRVWDTCSSRRVAREHGMPFTVGYLQRQAWLGWGIRIGEHRAARAIHELRRKKILRPSSNYRSKRHGFRVVLYALAPLSSSVRRTAPVKPRWSRRRWWEHALFGTFDGKPPPGRRKR